MPCLPLSNFFKEGYKISNFIQASKSLTLTFFSNETLQKIFQPAGTCRKFILNITELLKENPPRDPIPLMVSACCQGLNTVSYMDFSLRFDTFLYVILLKVTVPKQYVYNKTIQIHQTNIQRLRVKTINNL